MKKKNIEEFYDVPIKFRKKYFLRGVGEKYLSHKHFEKWYEYIIKHYYPPKEKKIALFTVCSWGKPYSQSYIHYFIQKKIMELGKKKFDKIHQIIVSNCGVIPREFENYYPFCSYDWDPNFEWDYIKEKYAEVLANRLLSFLEKFGSHYDKMFCYLRHDSDSYEAIKIVEKDERYLIPNLLIRETQSYELTEISLDGIYDDCDLVLITKSSLESLQKELLNHL